MNNFKSVIFDFDSTLVSIEGIDELARMSGMFKTVSQLTQAAMDGSLSFEEVLQKRLELIKPNQKSLSSVASLYLLNILSGAREVIQSLQLQGISVFVVSGGYKNAILPTTKELGIPTQNVFAITLQFDAKGNYAGFDDPHELGSQLGKQKLISQLKCDRDIVLIGDGSTDQVAASSVDRFIAFTGVVTRPQVINSTRYIMESYRYEHLQSLLC